MSEVVSTFVVAMELTKLACWNPLSLTVTHTSHRGPAFSQTIFGGSPTSSSSSGPLTFKYNSTYCLKLLI